jgi:hypothetical protein
MGETVVKGTICRIDLSRQRKLALTLISDITECGDEPARSLQYLVTQKLVATIPRADSDIRTVRSKHHPSCIVHNFLSFYSTGIMPHGRAIYIRNYVDEKCVWPNLFATLL